MSGCIYFFKSKTKNNIILDWGIKNKFKFKIIKIKVRKFGESKKKKKSCRNFEEKKREEKKKEKKEKVGV